MPIANNWHNTLNSKPMLYEMAVKEGGDLSEHVTAKKSPNFGIYYNNERMNRKCLCICTRKHFLHCKSLQSGSRCGFAAASGVRAGGDTYDKSSCRIRCKNKTR